MRFTRYPLLALSASLFSGFVAPPVHVSAQQAAPATSPSATPAPATTTAPTDLRPEAVSRRVAALPPPPAEGVSSDLGFESVTTAGGLTADQLAAMAVANAPSVQRANALIGVAEGNRDMVRVNLYPRVSANARAIYYNHIVNGGFTTASLTPEQRQVLIAPVDTTSGLPTSGYGGGGTAGAALVQFLDGLSNAKFPFYRGQIQTGASIVYPVSSVLLQILPQYRAAGHGVAAARLQHEAEMQNAWQQARNLYYIYVRTVGAERIAEVSLEAARAQLERMQALKDAGVVSNADLYRIEALVSSAEVAVVSMRTQRETATRALQLFVTSEDEALPALSIGEDFSAEVPDPQGTLEELEGRALDERSELEALRELYAAQLDRIRSARGSRYPVIGVGAETTYSNPNTMYFPQTRTFRSTWDINAYASWSPNDFALGSAQARREAAERNRIEADHAELVDGIRLEVAQSYNNYVAAKEAIVSARAELRASVETYRARFEQLQHGTIETTAVVDAFTALANARLKLVDAAIGIRVARNNLARAVGDYAEPARQAAR